MRIIKRIEYYFLKGIDGIGLAAFRILFFGNLLNEVIYLFGHRKMYFDPIPFIEGTQVALFAPLLIWILSLVCLVFGFKTRLSALVNYIFILVFLTGLTTYEYHMDYVYTGVSFLSIFMPIGRVLSLDRYFKMVRNRKFDAQFNLSRKVKAVNYYVPVLFGLAVVYTDSIFFKLDSPMWMGGLGMWLPASMPPVTIWNDSFLLNSEILMKSLGYLTLVFEFSFMFLFWFKRFRVPLLIIGIGLHFGIYMEFPIPFFAWGSIGVYLLMVPIHWWLKLERGVKSVLRKLHLKYPGKIEPDQIKENEIDGVEIKPSIPKMKFELVKFKFFITGVVLLILLQLNISLFSPFPYKLTHRVLNVLPTSINNSIVSTHKILSFCSKQLFGITFHPVFMDGHFRDLHTIAIEYKGENGMVFLPLINPDGMPNSNLKSGAWVNWVFRIGRSGSETDRSVLHEGIMRYTAFWIGSQNMGLHKKYEFKLLERKNDAVFKWEPNLLEKNLNKEWVEFGDAEWENEIFSMQLNRENASDGRQEN